METGQYFSRSPISTYLKYEGPEPGKEQILILICLQSYKQYTLRNEVRN